MLAYMVGGAVVLATLVTLVLLAYPLVLVDSITTKLLFFKGVDQNCIVALSTIGGHIVRFFARVEGKNFNPVTGFRNNGKQSDFYSSPILNHFANFWGIYYKGINTKLVKPDWCDSHQIPHSEEMTIETLEAEVAGIPFTINTIVVTEKTDMMKYFVLGTSKDPFKVVMADYNSEMRNFSYKRGEIPVDTKEINYRTIFGIKTEITKDDDFEKGPYKALQNSCTTYGLEVTNISIGPIYPTDPRDRDLLTQEARAEITRRTKITEAKGTSEATAIEADGNAKAIKVEGEAKIAYERELIKAGVAPSHRNAMALEKLSNLTYLSQGRDSGDAAFQINPEKK